MLDGKIVWITGAGSGIGRACAIAFAEAGARVALTGRRAAPLEETAALTGRPENALVVAADLSEPGQLEQAHQRIVAEWGDPDVLVNNAGWNIGRRHWREVQPEAMSGVVDLLLKAPFQASLLVLPAMRARRQGTIVQIASLAGVTIHPVSGPAYTAAKTGLVAMSDSLNAEEGINGIRSICICPGETETPILDTRPRPPTPEARALMMQPEDIAAAVLFSVGLPARACVTRMVIQPTDENFFRPLARTIAGMADA